MQVEYWQIIIGTLSAFIVAFLVEPVKTYFTNRAKKASLKESIYREIASNYHLLSSLNRKHSSPEGYPEGRTGAGYIIRNLHQECYHHIIEKDPVEFYRLEEAPDINLIYAKISSIITFIDTEGDEQKIMGRSVSMSEIRFFMEEIAMPLALGRTDRRLLQKISRELSEDIAKNRKQYIGQDLMHYIGQFMSRIPEGVDKSDYLSSMFSQLVDEVAKGKNPEDVLPKIRVEPSGKKEPSIRVNMGSTEKEDDSG